jgi:hypothetical protein
LRFQTGQPGFQLAIPLGEKQYAFTEQVELPLVRLVGHSLTHYIIP